MDDERFEVRKSRIHGRGLFARRALPARRKLGELQGELIGLREARRRARERPCIAIVEFQDDMALDASKSTGCFRYVNHSCTPNTYMRCIGHHVEFYALRAIRPGEELTCDYGQTQHEGTLQCQCSGGQCRRYL